MVPPGSCWGRSLGLISCLLAVFDVAPWPIGIHSFTNSYELFWPKATVGSQGAPQGSGARHRAQRRGHVHVGYSQYHFCPHIMDTTTAPTHIRYLCRHIMDSRDLLNCLYGIPLGWRLWLLQSRLNEQDSSSEKQPLVRQGTV